MKRGVATITVYVYGKTVDELEKKGQQFTKVLSEYDCESNAEMERLHIVPFGKIGHQEEIKLDRN